MAGLLQLFLDLDRGLFVRNAVDPSPISPGPFTQGENVPVDLTLLRANPTGSLLIPYQIVTDASSCKFGLCTPGPSVSTIHARAAL